MVIPPTGNSKPISDSGRYGSMNGSLFYAPHSQPSPLSTPTQTNPSKICYFQVSFGFLSAVYIHLQSHDGPNQCLLFPLSPHHMAKPSNSVVLHFLPNVDHSDASLDPIFSRRPPPPTYAVYVFGCRIGDPNTSSSSTVNELPVNVAFSPSAGRRLTEIGGFGSTR